MLIYYNLNLIKKNPTQYQTGTEKDWTYIARRVNTHLNYNYIIGISLECSC